VGLLTNGIEQIPSQPGAVCPGLTMKTSVIADVPRRGNMPKPKRAKLKERSVVRCMVSVLAMRWDLVDCPNNDWWAVNNVQEFPDAKYLDGPTLYDDCVAGFNAALGGCKSFLTPHIANAY
jgi:hypothetical protein